jgi:hypothetical protein
MRENHNAPIRSEAEVKRDLEKRAADKKRFVQNPPMWRFFFPLSVGYWLFASVTTQDEIIAVFTFPALWCLYFMMRLSLRPFLRNLYFRPLILNGLASLAKWAAVLLLAAFLLFFALWGSRLIPTPSRSPWG